MAIKPRGKKQLPTPSAETTLRIIGGRFRASKIQYSGDPKVRPMKDRTREAVFNLLGPDVKGTHAIDLFGGTGAMAIESISRGSVTATIIERHLPTARVVRDNLEGLNLQDQVELIRANTFAWAKQGIAKLTQEQPWTVFCCPPYRLYEEMPERFVDLLGKLRSAAPSSSKMIVEAEAPFDFAMFEPLGEWDVRTYGPTVIGMLGPLD